MICIFDKNAREFEGIGLGALSPLSCELSEEINGGYEIKMVHPRDKWGKWRYIDNERIIVVDTPNGRQPFRIYRVNPDTEEISVYAEHIFYDLLNNISVGKILEGTAKKWMEDFIWTFEIEMPFTFGTDIDSETTARQTYDGENQVSMLIGNSDSFVSFFGGECIRDKFSVFFAQSMGQDTGYLLKYGKNLIGLEVDEDLSDTYTKAYVYGKESAFVRVESPRINDYVYPKIKFIEYNDTDDREEIINRINKEYENGADLPVLNVKVDFVQLEKTEEYKDFSFLKNIKIGDTITVYHKKMNFNKKVKMISYKYDCILNEYKSIQLGELRGNLADSITEGKSAYAVAASAKNSVTQVSNVISGNVAVTPDFLYLPVDTANYQTAQSLYRLGKNGMEYGANGYQGAFNVLVDQSGGGGGSGVGGTTVLHGAESPSNDLGNDGDYYIKDESKGVADENTKLLLHGEDFTDSSMYNEEITNTGCTISDGGKIGKAIFFTNLNKLETSGNVFNVNGQFTIEFWAKHDRVKSFATYFCGFTNNNTLKLQTVNNKITLFIQGTSYKNVIDFSPVAGEWFHFAMTGNNKSIKVYINGTLKSSFTISNTLANSNLLIGLNPGQDDTGSIEGYLDEFRISDVVRWDSDFTPPTEPYSIYQNSQSGEIYVKESGTWRKILTGGSN